jgi:hypothetical protein
MAIDEPVTIIPKAAELFPSGAIFTAIGDTIDQKMEWEHATHMRETISIPKLCDKDEKMWLATNRATTDSISLR